MITVRELKEQVRFLARTDEDLKLLTADEFAQMYGYSSGSMRTMIKRGRISRAFKVGKEWFIPEDASIYGKQYKKKSVTKCIGIDGFCT